MRWEGAPDSEFFRDASWACLNEQPRWASTASGRPADPRVFRLAVTVPGRALGDRRKQGLVEEATKLVPDAEDEDRDARRVWVHIHELPDGNWGAAGLVIMFAELREAVDAARGDA